MEKFGTLEFVLDRYSGTWCWKISGNRAVNMVSKLIPRGWYGDKPNEVIVSDNDENTKKLKMIELQLKKMKLDQTQKKDDGMIEGEGYVIADRNDILKSFIDKKNDK